MPRLKQSKQIQRELDRLIEKKQSECGSDDPGQLEHQANMARAEINKKYGKSWRTDNFRNGKFPGRRSSPSEDPRSPYYGHTFGEHWMD